MTDAQNIFAELQFRRYYKKTIDTAELGVRNYERALKHGNSVWAACRLAGLYGCDGRTTWRSFEKARPISRNARPIPKAVCSSR